VKVTVIGGTGRIGKRVVAMLAADGHDVLAVNRRPERAAAVLAGVPVRTGTADTNDPETVAGAVEGADVVVLATAPTREDPAAYLRQTQHVVDAAKARGQRLVVLSSYVALRAPDGRTMLEAEPAHPYFRPIEELYVQQAEMLRAEQDLDWLLVAPPAELFPYGEVTRTYRTGEDVLLVSDPDNPSYHEVSALSMEDLATFVADEVVHPRHHRTLVTVAY
jgi:putative NADH-flavin reductase